MRKAIKVLGAVAMTAALVLAACGGRSNQTSGKGASSGAGNVSAAPAGSGSEDRNGFDEATNTAVTIAGVQFQLPSYFDEGKASDSGAVSYALESVAAFFTQEASVSANIDSFSDKQIETFENNIAKVFDNDAESQSPEQTTIAGKPAVLLLSTGISKDKSCTVKAAMFFDNAAKKLGMLWIVEREDAQYSYLADFDRVIASGVAVESGASASSDGMSSNEVSTDLKEWLDSYEAFMDEYVDFMQRYKESGNATSMLAEYSTYLQKYSDFAAKTEALDTGSMSAADYAYYIEVTTRVSQKLLSASV